jgi:hypothetical protein
MMLATSNLLTAFMLGGWLAVTPAVLSGETPYAKAPDLRAEKAGNEQPGRRAASRNRHGGSDYAYLNQ